MYGSMCSHRNLTISCSMQGKALTLDLLRKESIYLRLRIKLKLKESGMIPREQLGIRRILEDIAVLQRKCQINGMEGS